MTSKQYLDKGWEFTQIGGGEGTQDGEWLPSAKAATSVHVELLRLKKIPDPFVGLNEHDVQWIGESEWAFRTTFDVKAESLKEDSADLVFEGLDTYATVELNGTKIVETNNMMVAYRVPVKEQLKEGTNTLLITFPSTFLKGKQLEKANGKFALWNGDSSRLHVRKAQYNYGWDWGPTLMTVGPWKPIYLHTYTHRITDFHIRSSVSENKEVTLDIDIISTPPPPSTSSSEEESAVNSVAISLIHPAGLVKLGTQSADINADGSTTLSWEQGTDELELWYPVGYGSQVLYTIEAKLLNAAGDVVDVQSKRVGFRRVRVVQDELEGQEGRSFLFEVNGVRVFCGGSNWIPADSFLTEVTAERYRDWLQLMVDGHQNMVRIWAGGVFEKDEFYDICDELGIMVWQDFLFGCGQYPAYDEFLARIKVEAEQAVVRLRHHASLVIFAGNNEDYQVAESLSLELDYSDEDPKSDYRKTNFPARHIYERVLPEICARLAPEVFYHRASPYSGFGKDTRDRHYGDIHQWNVWHGSQEPWHNWDQLSGRFVSEFGMEGFPDRRTVDYWTGPDKSERHPQSRTTNSHNKADGFERRLELYLVENFKHAFDMDSYIYYTQVMQAETLASAYRLWRRNWQGPGREYTSGALVWQINDCWPVTSWAIVDYFLRPKPAFFSIARELRPYTVGMTRKDVKKPLEGKPDSAAFFEVDTRVEIWGANSTLEDKPVSLVIEAFDLLDTTFQWKEEHAHVLGANRSTELWQGKVPGQAIRTKLSEVPRTIIISARIVEPKSGVVLARYANWPEPFKFIHFPTPEEVGLKITTREPAPGKDTAPLDTGIALHYNLSRRPVEARDVTEVRLSVLRPVKGLVLDAEGDADVKWSDQAIDLVPGDEQVILAWGLEGRVPVARYLGDGTA